MKLKFLRYVFATGGLVLVIYSFITENYESQPIPLLTNKISFHIDRI